MSASIAMIQPWWAYLFLESRRAKVEYSGSRDDHTTNDTIIKTTDLPATEFFMNNHLYKCHVSIQKATEICNYAYLMEIIKLFALDTTWKDHTMQMRTRTNVHGQKVVVAHLLHEFIGRLGTSIFKFTSFNSQGITNLADSGTELEVRFTIQTVKFMNYQANKQNSSKTYVK